MATESSTEPLHISNRPAKSETQKQSLVIGVSQSKKDNNVSRAARALTWAEYVHEKACDSKRQHDQKPDSNNDAGMTDSICLPYCKMKRAERTQKAEQEASMVALRARLDHFFAGATKQERKVSSAPVLSAAYSTPEVDNVVDRTQQHVPQSPVDSAILLESPPPLTLDAALAASDAEAKVVPPKHSRKRAYTASHADKQKPERPTKRSKQPKRPPRKGLEVTLGMEQICRALFRLRNGGGGKREMMVVVDSACVTLACRMDPGMFMIMNELMELEWKWIAGDARAVERLEALMARLGLIPFGGVDTLGPEVRQM